jgi:hypothetical protein
VKYAARRHAACDLPGGQRIPAGVPSEKVGQKQQPGGETNSYFETPEEKKHACQFLFGETEWPRLRRKEMDEPYAKPIVPNQAFTQHLINLRHPLLRQRFAGIVFSQTLSSLIQKPVGQANCGRHGPATCFVRQGQPSWICRVLEIVIRDNQLEMRCFLLQLSQRLFVA